MATVLVNGKEVEIGASERLNCIQAAAKVGVDLLAVGDDDCAVLCGSLASRHELRLHRYSAVRFLVADFDKAHAAAGDDGQFRMPAIRRDFNTDLRRCLNTVQPLARADFNFFTVY